jgi:NAD(P)H dehydrogenase (quinone)
MADVNVLVVFYSRYGNAEKLALAAGLGAIQANANIRLRRVADLADRKTIESDPAWSENLHRMNMDYVAPRPADPAWADVIFLVTPAESATELEVYVNSLQSTGSLAGKIAAPLTTRSSEPALEPLYAAAARAGLIVVPPNGADSDTLTSARAFGQRVSHIARALKQTKVNP